MDWSTYSSIPPGGDISAAGSEVRVYVERLEHKINSLALACQALWELLKENTDLSEEVLAERMQQIDLRDGVADGKITHTVIECPKCGRKTTRRHAICMYCSESIPAEDETFNAE